MLSALTHPYTFVAVLIVILAAAVALVLGRHGRQRTGNDDTQSALPAPQPIANSNTAWPSVDGLFTTGREWLIVLDTGGIITQVSSNMVSTLGSNDPLVGKLFADAVAPYALDNSPLTRLTAAVRAREMARLTLHIHTGDGPAFDMLILARPYRDAQGNHAGFRVTAMDVTAETQRENELRALAFTDTMTGLNNRPWLVREIEEALGRKQARALLFIHFPRLVTIANSLGREQAELFMVNVASRLREGLNAYQTVARAGPNSFAVLEKTGAPGVPVDGATELGRVLAKPFSLIDHDVQLVPAIGIAHVLPDTRDAEQWLADAEMATVRLTVRNKPVIAEYEPTTRDKLMRLRSLETDLRRAVYFEPSQLMGYYQPIYRINDGALIGFEMLARWVHHIHGMIPPLDFIPVAEESGLIAPLWVYLYARAMKDLERWNGNRKPGTPELFMSVNLSSRQFGLPGLIKTVDVLAEVTGMNPSHVKLELTETEMMEDTEVALSQMQALRARGFGLSVDDFGTGFSSLSYLHKLPVTDVKIDRSFIKTMHDSASNLEIVGTIIRLAGLLGHTTTAEGIETEADLQALRSLGCTNGQGFFFKKPIPAHEIDALLAA